MTHQKVELYQLVLQADLEDKIAVQKYCKFVNVLNLSRSIPTFFKLIVLHGIATFATLFFMPHPSNLSPIAVPLIFLASAISALLLFFVLLLIGKKPLKRLARFYLTRT